VIPCLFDKSFLQSLSVDEAVWFDHHFRPLVCPVFYAETLADLAKTTAKDSPAERVVQSIAMKFPEMSGAPCPDHISLATWDLLGETMPLDGRVPRQGGRTVKSGGQIGVVFDESPEALAFGRWQKGEFQEVERLYAAGLRHNLTSLDLSESKAVLRSLGATGKVIKTLGQAKAVADEIVNGATKAFERLRLPIFFFDVPRNLHQPIVRRWEASGRPALNTFAPYAAYAVTVEIFFQLAVAADLISSDRPSNRTDIAYLFYLPFSYLFVSGDKLHQKCTPLFLRDKQEFVWGPDLKADLKRMNAYYLTLPEAVREKGLNAIPYGVFRRSSGWFWGVIAPEACMRGP